MFQGIKNAASEFGFQMAVEFERPKIVKGFKEWLSNFTLDQFREMIVKNQMPPVTSDMFEKAQPFAKFLSSISVLDLLEFLTEASPDLSQMIQGMGEQGATYLVNMRSYMLECCRHPEKAPAIADTGQGKGPDIVTVTCDKCGKSFPMTREKAQALEKCPGCGAPAK
ncbi:MAG: hypothetical protein PHI12_12200 [Dehalococcoidales bacterium]|nr:hypothetical protein [Dehalococcoidales bacterium]